MKSIELVDFYANSGSLFGNKLVDILLSLSKKNNKKNNNKKTIDYTFDLVQERKILVGRM